MLNNNSKLTKVEIRYLCPMIAMISSGKTSILKVIYDIDFLEVSAGVGTKFVTIIRYNPEVATFKTTILEQKTNTIGGKYPYITRNGITNYKEFPLGGLLAQELDINYNEKFYNSEMYENTYHPHYRIIEKNVFEKFIKPFCK